jgi:hypothetical protein
VQILNNAMSDNVPRVGDVALRPTRAKSHVAERRAAAPRSPRRLPRRRCAYALLYAVASKDLNSEMREKTDVCHLQVTPSSVASPNQTWLSFPPAAWPA